MSYYAGIDVSLEQSSVCVLDGEGKIIREAKVASEPEALVRFFTESGVGDPDRSGSWPVVAVAARRLDRSGP